MKKFLAILLSSMLMLSLAVPAMAAQVENNTTHEYDAYQIFVATGQNGDGGPLGNITWGKGIAHASFLAALQDDDRFVKNEKNIFEGCTSAQDVAEVLAANTDVAPAFADVAVENLGTTKTDVPSTGNVELGLGYWLLVDTTDETENEANFAKNAALLQVINNGNLTIEAKYDVPEVDKTVSDNDLNIGDTITFTLTATMPTRLDGYETYKVVFHDTMYKGLTYNNDAKASVQGFTTSIGKDGDSNTTITITYDNVLHSGVKAGDTITVTYTATLNDDAIIGIEGNPNEVYLEYSNDPNWNGEGTEPTGNTPEKEVEVYTWEIPVFKYTGTDTPLKGAGFTLYKGENVIKLVADSVNEKGTPVYKVCTLADCDHNGAEDGDGHVTEIITGETGKFEIEGLEQGTYVLKETTTPAGYNTAADTTVTIGENGLLNPKTNENGAIVSVEEIQILNNTGSTLPETGGMGTTVFYAVGGVMVVAAVVLLITKKRMSAEG